VRPWLGERQREALDALEHAVLGGGALLLLTGEVGVGKTVLASALVARLGDRARVARLPYPRLDAREAFEALAAAFGLDLGDGERSSFVEGIARVLEDSGRAGPAVLVIVDEAQQLVPDALAVLAELPGVAMSPDAARLSVLLVGPDELHRTLADHPAGLGRLVTIARRLSPLTPDEVREYVGERLALARPDAPAFRPDSLRAIADISGGVPRVIDTLCDIVLEDGSRQRGEVDALAVQQCARRLGLTAPQPPRPPVAEPARVQAEPMRLFGEHRDTSGRSTTRRRHGWRRRRRYAVAVALGLAGGAIVVALASTAREEPPALTTSQRPSPEPRAAGFPGGSPEPAAPFEPALPPEPAALPGPPAVLDRTSDVRASDPLAGQSEVRADHRPAEEIEPAARTPSRGDKAVATAPPLAATVPARRRDAVQQHGRTPQADASRAAVPAKSTGRPPARQDTLAPAASRPSAGPSETAEAAGGPDPGAIIDWLLRERR
jgi:general secretion pathway protein A